jgi:hypothetical protein
MAEVSPLRRRMIEDMTIRNLSPATQQSYLCGCQIQPPLWPLARPIGAGGCACLPVASHRAEAVVVAHQLVQRFHEPTPTTLPDRSCRSTCE